MSNEKTIAFGVMDSIYRMSGKVPRPQKLHGLWNAAAVVLTAVYIAGAAVALIVLISKEFM